MYIEFDETSKKYSLIENGKTIGKSKSKKYLESKMNDILDKDKPNKEDILKEYSKKLEANNENKEINKYRLDLSLDEILLLKLVLEESSTNGLESILNKMDNIKIIKFSIEKIKATKEATKVRSNKAKEKIQNAINILRLEDKKITHYSIAKVGKVSYITVKKHISDDKIILLNKEY